MGCSVWARSALLRWKEASPRWRSFSMTLDWFSRLRITAAWVCSSASRALARATKARMKARRVKAASDEAIIATRRR